MTHFYAVNLLLSCKLFKTINETYFLEICYHISTERFLAQIHSHQFPHYEFLVKVASLKDDFKMMSLAESQQPVAVSVYYKNTQLEKSILLLYDYWQ